MSLSQAETLALLPEQDRQAVYSGLSDAQYAELQWDWNFWARPEQLLPPGEWLTWLVLAGRGFGKTRLGSEAIRKLVCGPTPLAAGQYSRIAVVAETAADARDVMIEGGSGILSVHPNDFRPKYEPSKRRLTWPNGAVASVYNATEPDQLRGPQHDLSWCDELAKWPATNKASKPAEEAWDMLQFGMRLGAQPRQIVTTTPKPIPIIKRLMKDATTFLTTGSTKDNKSNLAPSFFTQVVSRYEGTRLGRQELDAEILDDVPGALWSRATIDAARTPRTLPDMSRVIVSVDPSGTKGNDDSGDWIGIVVAGRGVDGRGYVLADRSCKLSPAGWGRRAVDAYHEFQADRLVAERNFGGPMVEHVIKTTDTTVAYSEVWASRGKIQRAEPVAALYEQGRVSHISVLSELEDQLCQMTPDGYLGDGSPDRADALVWALTELLISGSTYDSSFSWVS